MVLNNVLKILLYLYYQHNYIIMYIIFFLQNVRTYRWAYPVVERE